MQMPDLEVFKEIPGYRAILKAVLKTQIQSLVEQLSQQTGEESVIVTASLEDGSLTHLGSDFGKVFLDSHDQFKSQFLGFCLKRNQMLQKPQVAQANTARKKGPVAAGRRPRLAPYYTTNTARKAPRKSTPRSLQSQQISQYNENYSQGLEPAYSHCDGLKMETGNVMKTIVKIEPGLDVDENELHCLRETPDENKVYIENMSRAFPSNSYPDDEEPTNMKFKIEGVTGTHSMIGAVNQPGKKRGRGQKKMKLEQDGRQSGPKSAAVVTESHRSKRGRKIKIKNKSFVSDFYADAAAFGDMIGDDFGKDDAMRPYPCNQCPKRFKERHHLTYHLRTHSGQRPYVCDICSKTFTQSSSLNTHKKLHLNEINCGVCGISFRKKSDFSTHVCTSLTEFDVSNHGDETKVVIDTVADELTNIAPDALIDQNGGDGI